MEKVVLPNGLTVIYECKKGPSVVVEVMIKGGSCAETNQERGISHFLEHMLFEGTPKRPDNHAITNEIEKVGGDFNAYTTNERTCFYVKVMGKHFALAVDILSDMLQNPLFKEEHIAKEKNVVIKEIELMNDEPKYRQWILLQQNLFDKHPCRFPTYGYKPFLKKLTRERIQKYFQEKYVPNNMILAIVGDVPNWKKVAKEKFTFKPKKISLPFFQENGPVQKTKTVRVKKPAGNTYLTLGFRTVPRNHPDSYAVEIIDGILGRGQSGKMFTELRSKKGLAYDVGTQEIAEASFGFFAVYACVDKKNIELVRKMILTEIQKLEHVSEKDIQEAKDYLEGSYYLSMEDSQKISDQLLFWENYFMERKTVLNKKRMRLR